MSRRSTPRKGGSGSRSEGGVAAPAPPRAEVIYLDEELLALNKPAGVPTTPTLDPHRVTLTHLAASLGLGYAEAAHRLDRDTTGVVLFGRSPQAVARLCAAFERREAQKLYWALCARVPEGVEEGADLHRFESVGALLEWARALSRGELDARERCAEGGEGWLTLHAPLKERRAGGRGVWEVVRAGGRGAVSRFRALALAPGLCLMAARPLTGRTHQLRAHLAHLGAPILGDREYGGEAWGGLGLHARGVWVEGREFRGEVRWQPCVQQACVQPPPPSGTPPRGNSTTGVRSDRDTSPRRRDEASRKPSTKTR